MKYLCFPNKSTLQTMCALLLRDLKVLMVSLRGTLIDGFILMFVYVIVLGYLLPTMGMPSHFIAPVYMGNLILFFLQYGFAAGFKQLSDLRSTRFIDYQLTVPISTGWLITTHVITGVIQLAAITLPLVTVGVFILRAHFNPATMNIPGFFIMYLLSLTLTTITFMAAAYWYTYEWYLANIWPRRLSPLACFGGVFFPLAQVEQIVPTLSILFRINPITYLGEGLRAGLLGSHASVVPLWQSMLITVGFILLACWGLKKGFKKRLDPV